MKDYAEVMQDRITELMQDHYPLNLNYVVMKCTDKDYPLYLGTFTTREKAIRYALAEYEVHYEYNAQAMQDNDDRVQHLVYTVESRDNWVDVGRAVSPEFLNYDGNDLMHGNEY